MEAEVTVRDASGATLSEVDIDLEDLRSGNEREAVAQEVFVTLESVGRRGA